MTDQSRLILGTAQLGMPYGIANCTGQPDTEEAVRIVTCAWNRGVHSFDTAPSYGKSEVVLGKVLRTLSGPATRIVTKISAHDNVESSLQASMQRLGVDHIDTVLLHDQRSLDDWSSLKNSFSPLLDSGLLNRVGVSVYTLERAMQALSLEGIKAIQFPGNVLDQRFTDSRFIDLAADRGVQLMIRSVFLQGLLLMEPANVPNHLADVIGPIQRLHTTAISINVTRQSLLLGFAAQRWPDAMVLFGAESHKQTFDNLSAWNTCLHIIDLFDIAAQIKGDCISEYIIRPDMWSTQ